MIHGPMGDLLMAIRKGRALGMSIWVWTSLVQVLGAITSMHWLGDTDEQGHAKRRFRHIAPYTPRRVRSVRTTLSRILESMTGESISCQGS